MTPDELKTVEEAARLLGDYQKMHGMSLTKSTIQQLSNDLHYGDRIFVTRVKLEEMSRKERKNGQTTA